jgi:UDP-glucose 4-epimerase
MRIVVTGATGNVGTSVIEQLALRDEVESIVGLARRSPGRSYDKTSFVQADIASDDLSAVFRGADVVIHLAWLIQPGRTESITRAVNVGGSQRVFDAVAAAEVPSLVHASSVGAYSPGPKDRTVAEDWPTQGIPSSFYSRHKAEVEHRLDVFEATHPDRRVVRLRPGLIFKAEAATEIRRLFLGPFFPTAILRYGLVPVVPELPELRFQGVHSTDIGEAYTLAALNDQARGAFNIAAQPIINSADLAKILHARRIPVSGSLLRGGAALAYRLRATPTEPGWVDLALQCPLMDTSRGRDELGWEPRHDGLSALAEIIAGIGRGDGQDTPPLAHWTTAPFRLGELKTRLGARP